MVSAGRHIHAQSANDAERSALRLRVLIVDDERDTVATLSELVTDEGYQVRGVYKARDALAAMGDFDPDVVLLDLALPDLSGWEVARQIRARYGDKRPVLIAITGRYKQPSDRLLGQLAGFDHQLEKPCDPHELLKLLAKQPPATS